MVHADESIPPRIAGLSWRPLRGTEVAKVAGLMRACLAVDGGLPLAAQETFIRERFLPPEGRGISIAGFDLQGRLVALATVQRTDTAEASVASSEGHVRPDHRGLGLGTYLIEWSRDRAQRLLSDAPSDRPRVWELSSESLSAPAKRLFASHGLQERFIEAVMRLDPACESARTPFPPGVTLRAWTPDLAGRFFAAYAASFADRPGFPGWDERTWVRWAIGDDDFAPEASFIALAEGQPVGFIVCAREWITQAGVRPAWRRRGIGSALVTAALSEFRGGGARQVLLDVNRNNPAAIALYERLGFQRIGERGRFARTLS